MSSGLLLCLFGGALAGYMVVVSVWWVRVEIQWRQYRRELKEKHRGQG